MLFGTETTTQAEPEASAGRVAGPDQVGKGTAAGAATATKATAAAAASEGADPAAGPGCAQSSQAKRAAAQAGAPSKPAESRGPLRARFRRDLHGRQERVIVQTGGPTSWVAKSGHSTGFDSLANTIDFCNDANLNKMESIASITLSFLSTF